MDLAFGMSTVSTLPWLGMDGRLPFCALLRQSLTLIAALCTSIEPSEAYGV